MSDEAKEPVAILALKAAREKLHALSDLVENALEEYYMSPDLPRPEEVRLKMSNGRLTEAGRARFISLARSGLSTKEISKDLNMTTQGVQYMRARLEQAGELERRGG